jgi:hypothetical protein
MMPLGEKITAHVSASSMCPVCGRPAKRTKEYSQRVGYHNLDEHGSQKSRYTIQREVREAADRWKAEQVKKGVTHLECRKKKEEQRA